MTAALHGGSELGEGGSGQASSAPSTGPTGCSSCDVGAVAHGGHCVARLGSTTGGRVVFVRHALPGERVRAVVTRGQRRRVLPGRRGRGARRRSRPGRAAVPVGPRRGLRGLRLAARRRADPARAEGRGAAPSSCSGWPGSSRTSPSNRCPRMPGRPAGLAAPGAARRRRRGPGRAAGPPQPRRAADRRLPARPAGGAAAGARAAVRRRRRGRGGDRRRGDPAPAPGGLARCPARRSCSARSGGSGTCRRARSGRCTRRWRRPWRTWCGEWAQAPAGGARLGPLRRRRAVRRGAGRAGRADGEVRSSSRLGRRSPTGAPRSPTCRRCGGRWAASSTCWRRSRARPDVVVADPPRRGLGRATGRRAVRRARPGRVVHVACDPAALARDVALFAAQATTSRTLRAFDAFPMTHHMECVALFQRP